LEGAFETYAKLRLKHSVGALAIDSICLTMSGTLLRPKYTAIPSTHAIYVPVLSVSSIAKAV
ncbi:MAG TPA: hypothetical protein VM124_03305, partial [Candidatus Limnocylindrales bacterium]|nr:hypothetical protein [Candidatus Limnocylindrales bacterium]